MKFFLQILVVVAGVAGLPQKRVSYEGHRVIRAIPEHDIHLDALNSLYMSHHKVDFWSEPRSINTTVDIMMDWETFDEIDDIFKILSIPFFILIENVQRKVENIQSTEEVHDNTMASPTLNFTKYYRMNKINSWLHELAAANPNIVQLETIGRSYEGRDLTVVKIGRNDGTNKSAIWIDGGNHAREWIASSTALYIIDQLINNYANHSELVEKINWFILPVLNPDGYEYTHTTDRLWRKTRSDNLHYGCKGTDANRNWDFHWNEAGVSSHPCSIIYRGMSAFSEPETKATAEFILRIKNNLHAYVSFHSYGQVCLLPWAYTTNLPSDYDALVSLAEKATNALKQLYGTEYAIGSTANIMYPASGSSMDWAKGVAGIKYAYTFELRDRENFGFLLPTSEIIPTGKETFESMKVFANHIIKGNE